jgi:hypothetical protein
MAWKVTDSPSFHLYELHDDNLGTVKEKVKTKSIRRAILTHQFLASSVSTFRIFLSGCSKRSRTSRSRKIRDRGTTPPNAMPYDKQHSFFRTSHFYTLGDGHKSNWNFRRHVLTPSSGKSGEVSNYLVGPTTWGNSFITGNYYKWPNRKYAHLHILPGAAGRGSLWNERQIPPKWKC